MQARLVPDADREWIIEQARSGAAPDVLLQPLLAAGWTEAQAVDAVDDIIRAFLARHAAENALPPPSRVPSPVRLNDVGEIDIDGQRIAVIAQLLHPRIVVFGNLLTNAECDWLQDAARDRLRRSLVVDETGGERLHDGRTSEGTEFTRAQHPVIATIEQRIATLLDWPVENGEGLQVLRYGPGNEYQPHYDYFDPAQPGSEANLRRGGQRVASVVMYLNTPERGGATVFPDVRFEVAARRGNAVFFAYDRPHPMTRTRHGGAPVIEGEKWIVTKWLRERRHD